MYICYKLGGQKKTTEFIYCMLNRIILSDTGW